MNFCKKASFALALLLASSENSTQAAYTQKYGYIFNGADWTNDKDKDSKCSSTHQSPIDLRSSLNSDPNRLADGRDFVGSYQNLVKATSLNKGKKITVSVPSKTTDGVNNENYFKSKAAIDTYNAAKKYSATHIDLHGMSEHTVDGRRYDLEMKIVHSADKESGARRLEEVKSDYAGQIQPNSGVISIFFDQTNYDSGSNSVEQQAIWDFFESIKLDSASVDEDADKNTILAKDINVPLGDLMKTINFGNRWTYSGSETAPPCTIGVVYQIVERVLPISKKHYAAFSALQKKHTSVDYFDATGANQVADDTTTPKQRLLSDSGNYRITNKIDYHNVRYMRADFSEEEETDPTTTMYALAIVLAISAALSLILAYCACMLMRSEQTVKAADDEVGMASARSSARSSGRNSQLA